MICFFVVTILNNTPRQRYLESSSKALLSVCYFFCTLSTVNGSLRVTIQGEVIEKSFGEEELCFRTLQRFTAATLEHGMHPPFAPKPAWRTLMDDMAGVSTEEYRATVFKNPSFVPYFRAVSA